VGDCTRVLLSARVYLEIEFFEVALVNIVIVGAKDRNSVDDGNDVETLIGLLGKQYGTFTAITAMTHVGIGAIVKRICGSVTPERPSRIPLVEADVRIFAHNLSQETMTQFYLIRNAMLFEAGDLFYSFPHPQRRNVIDELMNKRVIPAGRPHRIFLPGDLIETEPEQFAIAD
jgi:hypothetical protein